MRIGLDGRLYRTSAGGIGRYSRELITNLLQIDPVNEYILFLTPADKAECVLAAPNLRLVVTPITHFTLGEQLKLPTLLAKERLHLTHFLNFNHPVLYRSPFITTIHDLTMNFFPVARQNVPIRRQAYLYTMRHAARAAEAVIVPTQVVKEDVVRYLGAQPEKIAVIHEGVKMPKSELARPKKVYLASLKITKPYILFVSQWRPHKGLGVLINAFQEIKKHHDIQLVITGQANPQFPEVSAAIDSAVNREDIITPGFVSDEVLDTLYAGAEIFIFPSWYEGFGLPPLEAMARGLPVAASHSSVMPEVLGDAAVYFDPRSAANMASVIGQTLGDPERLRELKTKGYKQAAKYSWRKMAKETLALYQQVLKR